MYELRKHIEQTACVIAATTHFHDYLKYGTAAEEPRLSQLALFEWNAFVFFQESDLYHALTVFRLVQTLAIHCYCYFYY